MLILDEATSAVDNETEAAIRAPCTALPKGNHGDHRPPLIDRAPRRSDPRARRLAEAGSHEELLAEEGLYHQLWSVQTGSR